MPEIRSNIKIDEPRDSVIYRFCNPCDVRIKKKVIDKFKQDNAAYSDTDAYASFLAELENKRFDTFSWPFRYPVITSMKRLRPRMTPDGFQQARIKITTETRAITDPIVVPEVNKRLDEPCAVAIGPIILTSPCIANYRSTNNWYDGMRKRMIHVNKFEPKLMWEFQHFVYIYVKTHYEPLEYFPINLETANEFWLNPCKHYTVKRKNVLRSYISEYLEKGLGQFKEDHKNFYACMSFIKREFYSEVKTARIINSRSDEFKALCGAHIKLIENAITHNEHFVKTTTLATRAKRMKEIIDKYQYVVETDYSSFEGTQSCEFHQACEAVLFKHMLANNIEVWSIIRPIFRRDHLEKCISMPSQRREFMTFEGSRMSGDLWTSLGNGFSNMMVFLFTLHRMSRLGMLNVTQDRPIDADWLCEGDDGYFAANVDFSAMFEQTATDLGLKMKMDHGQDINDVSFCSTCVGPGGLPVPNFWRLLEKFGWVFEDEIITHYTDKPTKAEMNLLWSKTLSLNASSQGIPILQPLSVRLAKIIKNHRVCKKWFSYWEIEQFGVLEWTIQEIPITMEMRHFFAQRFGVSVEKQFEVEKLISKMTNVRTVLPLIRPSVKDEALFKECEFLQQ